MELGTKGASIGWIPISGVVIVLVTVGCSSSLDQSIRNAGALTDDRSRPLLIVDLDDTVVDGSAWNSFKLSLDWGYSSTRPFLNAAECLNRLSEKWQVVFLTARAERFSSATLDWLEQYEFPEAPVIFSADVLSTSERRRNFKTSAVRSLIERGYHPEVGVGDKASDIAAYLGNEIRAILLLSGPDDEDLTETLQLLDGAYPDIREGASLELLLWPREDECAGDSRWERVTDHLTRRPHPE